jgi:hypothetical protein
MNCRASQLGQVPIPNEIRAAWSPEIGAQQEEVQMNRMMFLIIAVVLSLGVNPSIWAQDEFGTIHRTMVVHPVPTNPKLAGTELLDAMADITNASATNPWLIKLDAGVYDLGTSSLTMKPYVDIEGSGEDVTKITAASCSFGTVNASNNAEVRFLTVNSSVCSAVFVPGGTSPKFTHVTLTAAVPGGSEFLGGLNSSGQPILTDVTVNLPLGGFGILLSGGEVLRRVSVTVAPAVYSIGIDISQNYLNVIPITIVDSIIVADQAVYFASGIPNFTIDRSTITGRVLSLDLPGSGAVRIGTSQLIGTNSGPFGLTCFADYDANYAPLNSSCQ